MHTFVRILCLDYHTFVIISMKVRKKIVISTWKYSNFHSSSYYRMYIILDSTKRSIIIIIIINTTHSSENSFDEDDV